MHSLTTELGKIFAIKGNPHTSSNLLLSLATKFQRHGKVLFIDLNNCFNQLYIKKNYHKQFYIRKIKVARPYTFDQLKKTIFSLKDTIPRNSAKSIIIAGLDTLLENNPLTTEQIFEELSAVTKKFNTFTILSFSKKEISKDILPYLNFCCNV